jgi:hypothetical protein
MSIPLKILAFDSIGALIAGTITLLAEPLLTAWYGWPEGLVVLFGCANIGYGCYSGVLSLTMRSGARLPPWTVRLLIFANAAWVVHCFVRVELLIGSISLLGLAHLILEAMWVGGLAYVEARVVLPGLKVQASASQQEET